MAWVFEEIRATRDVMRYGFAVGKVRVLETRTLDRSALERLLDAPSFREQRRILSETVYGRYLDKAETADDVDTGLESALDDFQKLLQEAELPDPVVHFFRLRGDYANLKAVVKARILGVSSDGLLTHRGELQPERFEDDPRELPAPYGALARDLLDESDSPREIAEVDAAIDRAQFAALGDAARDARSPFLQQVAALMSDIANTKVLVRARAAGLPAAQAAAMLVPGGAVDDATLMALYARPAAEMAEGLERLPAMRGTPTDGIAEPAGVDVVTDNALMRLLRTSRRTGTGPEPVIAYVLAREAEVQALRVLLVGKIAGLDSETLRQRLRDSYR